MTEQTILFYDTETSGFRNKSKNYEDPTQAWVVQLGWMLSKGDQVLSTGNFIVRPNYLNINKGLDFIRSINPKAAEVHGISVDTAKQYGHPEDDVTSMFVQDHLNADLLVCHNYAFDIEFLKDMIARWDCVTEAINFSERPHYCTMKSSTEFCALPHARWKTSFKWPKLVELHEKLFGEGFDGAHDALADVRATRRCYYELQKRGI